MSRAGRWRMLAMGVVLALALCVSAAAEEVDEDALEERLTGEWYWKLHPDGYAIVTGTVYGVNRPLHYEKEEPLVMPAELDGYPVRAVGSMAFFMAPWADLILPEGLTTIQKRAFDETSITSVYIPSTVTTIEHGAFSWSTMPCFEVSEGNPHYRVIDDMLITTDGKDLIAHGAWGSDYTIVVPDGVETIGENAFSCTGASKIILPDGVKTIEDHAFSDRSIDANIPASVQSIGCGVLSRGNVTFDGLPQSVDAYSL